MNDLPNEADGPTRRDVLAGAAGFLAAITGLAVLADPARAQAVRKPHIVYILADDLGFADVGFHGHHALGRGAGDSVPRKKGSSTPANQL